MPVRVPITCPILAGRGAELDALLALLEESCAGRCVMALVTGEAGSGKSRLVHELQQHAAARGFRTLTGGCTERDRDFPFAPFADLLRQQLMTPRTDPHELFGPHGERLVDLLPELHRFYPPRDSRLVLTPEQSKRQLFEAVAGVLARLAEREPVLIVLEDLHWADPTSLELFELLPRRLASHRLLLVATARADEIDDRLRGSIASLRRSRLLVELALDPLPDVAVAEMLEAMLPAGPSSLVARIILKRAGGNPFFVEELLATIAPTGADWLAGERAIPESVRDAVLRRLAGISAGTQRVVRVLAVAGQQVDLDVLRVAASVDDETLVPALAALSERGLLIKHSTPGRWSIAFKHALTRDAILDALSNSERRPLHRRVAQALESLASAEGLNVVADGDFGYHFHAAGEWEKALQYANRAGEAARSMHATFEALGHYRRALDAAIALGHPDVARMHCRCGQALDLLGGFEAARDHFDEALRLARQCGDLATEQGMLHELAGLYASRDYRRARQLAEQALALARQGGNRRAEGLALNRLGNILTNLQQFAQGRALHEDALALFEEFDDRWGSADSHDLIGTTRYLSGEVPEARAACQRAAAMFAELDAPERVASALTTRGLYLAVLDGPCATDAPPHAFRADAQRGLTLCRSIGWRSGEAYALVALAWADIRDAAYRDAARHLDAALAIVEEIGHEQWTVIARISYGILYAEIFDDRRALVQFEQALAVAERIGSVQWEMRLRTWIARCHARLGDPATAERLLALLLPKSGTPASISQRRALFTQAEIQLASGQAEQALEAVGRLLAGAAGPRPAATVLLRARSLAELGRHAEAGATFHEAVRLAAEYGPRSVRWQAVSGSVQLYKADPAAAEHMAAEARAEIAAIAGALPEDWRDTFLSAGEVRRWAEVEQRQRRGQRTGGDVLTRREREVAMLVSVGLTNKEIGARLSIAEKTVEMHVSNCLGKLCFSTRAQLAAWAVAQGLTLPPAAPE